MSKIKSCSIIFLVSAFLLPSKINASESSTQIPKFQNPISCEVGTDCWIVNYVDVDPSEEARDFTCAPRSYDHHKGVDFALRSLSEMKDGVAVKASMAGTILRLRNSETDTVKGKDDLEAIKNANKECGNGVLIDHTVAGYPGLQTMYCHLKKDSISIAPKDIVAAGDKVGEVGHSGLAEFPHLHFGILWENVVMDPFTGLDNTKGCGQMREVMWADNSNISYQAAAIYDSGFSNQIPDFEKIKQGQESPKTIASASDAFVFWSAFYGLQKDDLIIMSVENVDGKVVLERTLKQEKNRARQFYYTGRKINKGHIPAGRYTGKAILKRSGQSNITKQTTIIVN